MRKPERYGEINRRTTRKEFREAQKAARRAGLHRLGIRWRDPRSFQKIPAL